VSPVYRLAVVACLVSCANFAAASSDPFVDLLQPGATGIGYTIRYERSMYQGGESGGDQTPLLMYEGEHAYLHGTRLGLKLKAQDWRFDAFIRYRFEGFNIDKVPAPLAGSPSRDPGYDAGVSARLRTSWGTPYVEALHDVSQSSEGSELRLGYWNEWRRGAFGVRPHLMAAWRSAKLNNHYYGTATYQPGAGLDLHAMLYATYEMGESWRLLAGAGATRRSSVVTDSPIVQGGLQPEAFVGFMYDLGPKQSRYASSDGKPLIVKVLYGNSSDCDMLQIVKLSCTSRHTVDDTDVAAVHFGRKLIERAGGWSIDVVGFVGAQRHLEKGFQDDFWSVMAFIKPYFYGFPWDKTLRTRIGWGWGLSYAEQIPFMELRDQASHGRGNWKLLGYSDPSIEFQVRRDTFVGVGVSHRSGMFGKSQLFGNVNGGSNYIYLSLETAL
jgi:outer membrane protein